MFDNLKNKITAKIAEVEEKEREKERMEKEKIEHEKQRLLALDEKELLIELIFSMKKMQKEQEILLEKVENLDATIWSKQ